MSQTFTTNFAYDVFLSFRGEDTRYNFTGHLYDAFRRRGIETFFDDQNLRGGDELSPSLVKAIEESRMFVIVFSENYASSTWCLRELAEILQCAEKNNRRVWLIFYKVDPSDIRHQRRSYGDAMTKHEEKFGKDSERVSNWRSALTKVADLKGDHFQITGNEYEYNFIESIVKKISTTLLHKDLDVGEHVVGLEPRIRKVISLLDISSQDIVCRLGIHGIGGLGKTMLAKALYNLIVHQFKYTSFLSNVRETSNEPGGMVRLQNTLLTEMLEEDIKISNVDRGANIIKNRFHDKKVLLVLDDVDHKEQLEKLVGECNWFGSGSKIIVTTRDKHLLCASQFEEKYEMRGLNADEALELFSRKAFSSSQPPVEFVNLSNDVVKYASGLPLALKVIGSNLFGKDLKECVSALNRYKKIPDNNIQRILRISYDGLNRTQKEIFLDMACFFKGYYLQDVINIWRTSELDPEYDIEVLVNKSLITDGGYIGMHDLIQDMGKEVVRDIPSKESGKLSRLWIKEEVVKVLKENSGTDEVEGIMLKSPQQIIKWKGTAFKKMKNLRILIVKDARFLIGPKYLSNSLRVLIWDGYPSTSWPSNFDAENLVVLQITNSSFKLKKSFQDFKFLTMINFSYCQSITEVPDMSGTLALKTLYFFHCENLVKVHNSIGLLTEVRELNLAFCKNLTSLPSAMKMASLEVLHIEGCSSLEHFPNILEDMNCLFVIYANDTAIKELPNSISNLPSLEYLNVSGCKNLQEIHGIPSSLQAINAEGCTSLTLHSHNVLWSQAIKKKKSSDMIINMPGAQIPDWFDHRCKGRVLTFWARKKLSNATCAFVHNCRAGYILEGYQRLFINRVGVRNYSRRLWSPAYFVRGRPKVYFCDLEDALSEDVEKYLLQEWNYVEVVVVPSYGSSESCDCNMCECGIYVYKQGTRMEDVRFECPYITLPMELVLRNALKRGAAFHSENEPPKKLLKKHKPRDNGEKYQNPRTKERYPIG